MMEKCMFIFLALIGCAVIETLGVPEEVSIQISVLEEQDPPLSIISELKELPEIQSRFSPEELQEIEFHFLSEKPDLFSLEERSGLIQNTDYLDRDTICSYVEVCQIQFDLVTQPESSLLLVKVSITVQDANDNGPVFESGSFSHSISESAHLGSSILLPWVSDPDSPEFSVSSFVLNPQDAREVFDLRTATQGLHNPVRLKLILKAPLDREIQSEYSLTVSVQDGGIPPLSGNLTVNITVLDSNDNRPVFDSENYEVTIPENAPHGTTMIQVQANDPDAGLNGQIQYRFSQETPLPYLDLFTLNSETGEILVSGDIDFETTPLLYLTVEALDQGPNPVPDETIVTVVVTDTNDHAPEISVNTLRGSGVSEVLVQENATIGTFVARISVSDQDTGPNGEYNCSLWEEHFTMEAVGNSYMLLIDSSLDREIQADYLLTVVCLDHGDDPQLTGTAEINVKLTDINDQAPQFTRVSYYKEISENNHIGSILLQVEAVDQDEGSNAEVYYTIPADYMYSDRFEVDRITGVVKAKVPLDREVEDQYIVPVVATDRGFPPQSTTTEVVVMVTDTNDEAPSFSQSVYSFGIFENEPSGSDVGLVTAEDTDTFPYNQIIFSIQKVRTPSPDRSQYLEEDNPFDISSSTGQLTTVKVLDREEHGLYELTVVAQDKQQPQFVTTATVSIYVMDQNDNAPHFDFPGSQNHTVYLTDHVPQGTVITQLSAQDRDIAEAGSIRYTIQTATRPGVFLVDPELGTVSLGQGLSEPEGTVLILTVLATDSGDPPLSSTADLYIQFNRTAALSSGSVIPESVPNIVIIIIVACVSGVLILALILAITLVCWNQRYRRLNRATKHHQVCMEAMRNLSMETTLTASNHGNQSEADGTYEYHPHQTNPGADIGVGDHKERPSRIDLSLEKSRKWLETIETPEKGTSKPPPSPSKLDTSISGASQLPKDGNHGNPERDGESVHSGGASNTDSGRGISELTESEILHNSLVYPHNIQNPYLMEPDVRRSMVNPTTGLRSPSEAASKLPTDQSNYHLPSRAAPFAAGVGSYPLPHSKSPSRFKPDIALEIGPSVQRYSIPYPHLLAASRESINKTSRPTWLSAPSTQTVPEQTHENAETCGIVNKGAEPGPTRLKRQPGFHIVTQSLPASEDSGKTYGLLVGPSRVAPSPDISLNSRFLLSHPRSLDMSQKQCHSSNSVQNNLERHIPQEHNTITCSTLSGNCSDDGSSTSGSYVVDSSETGQQLDGLFYQDVEV